MYLMMPTIGWNYGFIVLWGLHILSVIVFFTGVFLLLSWAFKHLSERGLWKWGWVFVVLGTILCLLTISAWPRFAMMGGFSGGFGRSGYGMPMMGQWQGSGQDADGKALYDEMQAGKALYDEMQAKKTACADVSDSDFELIGEYLMGQMAGAGHEQMNAMMRQMMGKDGEEQMHIMMAKRVSGC